MAKTLYDPRCWGLAFAFLIDPPPGEEKGYVPDADVVNELAGVIQQAIEDWNENRTEG